jgi:hypothetical protein
MKSRLGNEPHRAIDPQLIVGRSFYNSPQIQSEVHGIVGRMQKDGLNGHRLANRK